MQFRCGTCNTLLSAGDEITQTIVRCPACATMLELPDPMQLADDPQPIARESFVSFRENRETIDTEMDMTPMVDVTFLLLIFFMVTAAFALQKSFQVPTPREDEASTQTRTLEDFEDDAEFIVVKVDQFNTYHVSAAIWDESQECALEQDLLVKLREARRGTPSGNIPTRLMVVAHGDARHDRVIIAMDAGPEVGIEDVKLQTVEEDI